MSTFQATTAAIASDTEQEASTSDSDAAKNASHARAPGEPDPATSATTRSLGKSKKRPKKPPGMPRRALTAYNYFFQEERKVILNDKDLRRQVDSHRANDHGCLARLVASRWKTIKPDVLQRYKELAAADAKRFSREMQSYQERMAREHGERSNPTSLSDNAIDASVPNIDSLSDDTLDLESNRMQQVNHMHGISPAALAQSEGAHSATILGNQRRASTGLSATGSQLTMLPGATEYTWGQQQQAAAANRIISSTTAFQSQAGPPVILPPHILHLVVLGGENRQMGASGRIAHTEPTNGLYGRNRFDSSTTPAPNISIPEDFMGHLASEASPRFVFPSVTTTDSPPDAATAIHNTPWLAAFIQPQVSTTTTVLRDPSRPAASAAFPPESAGSPTAGETQFSLGSSWHDIQRLLRDQQSPQGPDVTRPATQHPSNVP